MREEEARVQDGAATTYQVGARGGAGAPIRAARETYRAARRSCAAPGSLRGRRSGGTTTNVERHRMIQFGRGATLEAATGEWTINTTSRRREGRRPQRARAWARGHASAPATRRREMDARRRRARRSRETQMVGRSDMVFNRRRRRWAAAPAPVRGGHRRRGGEGRRRAHRRRRDETLHVRGEAADAAGDEPRSRRAAPAGGRDDRRLERPAARHRRGGTRCRRPSASPTTSCARAWSASRTSSSSRA